MTQLALAGVAFLAVACKSEPDAGRRDAPSCLIDVTAELSSAVPTVAIVTWSSSLPSLDSATIEFGKDETYGLTAPVDLEEPNHRTLLLGLRPSTTYHFRVVARSGSETCTGSDHTLTTGAADPELPLPDVTTASSHELAPGYLLVAHFVAGANGNTGGPPMPPSGGGDGGAFMSEGGAPNAPPGGMMGGGGAPNGMVGGPNAGSGDSLLLIFDRDGVLVWWRDVPIQDVSRVLMSHDGKSLVALSVNASGGSEGRAVRVSLDGLEVEPMRVPNAHHDFTLTPDGGMVFIVKGADDCDDLKLRGDRDGLLHLVRNLLDNAARYASSRVIVSTHADEREVVLRVDDDGPGIAASDRERIFERFTRANADRSRATGGVGLGLAVVRRVAEQFGGTVLATDAPAGGARLEVRFPAFESRCSGGGSAAPGPEPPDRQCCD
jgi:hypothetical protein